MKQKDLPPSNEQLALEGEITRIENEINIDPKDYAVWDNVGELSDVFHPQARYTKVVPVGAVQASPGWHSSYAYTGPKPIRIQYNHIHVVGTRPRIWDMGVKSFDMKIGSTSRAEMERERKIEESMRREEILINESSEEIRQFYLNELMHYLLNH